MSTHPLSRQLSLLVTDLRERDDLSLTQRAVVDPVVQTLERAVRQASALEAGGAASSDALIATCEPEDALFGPVPEPILHQCGHTSLLIDQLVRCGADPTGAVAFSSSCRLLVRQFGDAARAIGPWLRQAPHALHSGRTSWKTCFHPATPARAVRAELTELFSAGVLAEPPRVWVSDKRVCAYTTLRNDASLRALLKGHWLSAYTQWLIADQAERNRLRHESFACLEVRMPRDFVARRAVEYDTLALVGDRGARHALWVECKAGAVRNIHADRVQEAHRSLAQVLALSDETIRLSGAVVVPLTRSKTDRAAARRLREVLAPDGIDVVPLSGLRQWVMSTVRSQPMAQAA